MSTPTHAGNLTDLQAQLHAASRSWNNAWNVTWSDVLWRTHSYEPFFRMSRRGRVWR